MVGWGGSPTTLTIDHQTPRTSFRPDRCEIDAISDLCVAVKKKGIEESSLDSIVSWNF
jgi:hypothetical protein